ncbi:MAG TPA: glycerol acyltransferase [Opitutae bacterium]|nr:glycerol acyltransferase [Opitutae bacterium]
MLDTDSAPKLIDLDKVISAPWSALNPLLARGLSFGGVNQIYADVHAQLTDSEHDPEFFMKTLRVMDVQFEVDTESFDRIPKVGPLIVIANHPFGGVDGVVLGALLQSVRADNKLMGNYLLGKMEGIRGNIVEVDPFETEASKRANLQGMRTAIKLLREGGCLGAFPAGEVSSFGWKPKSVVDPKWTNHIVSLAKRTQAPILPIYFEGRNSLFFQAMGLIHPRLRTALLAREFCRAKGTQIKLRVGEVIQPKRIEGFDTDESATEYLRLKTYSLRDQPQPETTHKNLRLPFRSTGRCKPLAPLAPEQLKHHLRAEVEALTQDQLLVEHGDFVVCIAKSNAIPKLMLEIGRLREETFRAVQEGTGLARDLDEFDDYYWHLFMWDRAHDELVGAYRIGLADQIVEAKGKHGLYTATLFKYRTEFLQRLGPAIELGRSFICLKYQKKHASLALIWRGIGEFVVRNPHYKTLFGPVSITDAYHRISKDLMVHFFREHNFDDEMAQLVKPRKAPKAPRMMRGISLKNIGESINSVDSVSAIISGFEDDAKGIPILLKHYLKLNGVLLSFNVDPAFSDVIDGLILVDLTKTDPKVLQRYFGKKGYASFARYHDINPEYQVVE